MDLAGFTQTLKSNPENIQFTDTMNLIDQYYDFTPVDFDNGMLKNRAGQNSGSCKLFALAQLQKFSEQETLACFGAYYRDEVLAQPHADNHQNIRHFMQTGWDGIHFYGTVLSLKSHIST